jgi:hypothetical protein
VGFDELLDSSSATVYGRFLIITLVMGTGMLGGACVRRWSKPADAGLVEGVWARICCSGRMVAIRSHALVGFPLTFLRVFLAFIASSTGRARSKTIRGRA